MPSLTIDNKEVKSLTIDRKEVKSLTIDGKELSFSELPKLISILNGSSNSMIGVLGENIFGNTAFIGMNDFDSSKKDIVLPKPVRAFKTIKNSVIATAQNTIYKIDSHGTVKSVDVDINIYYMACNNDYICISQINDVDNKYALSIYSFESLTLIKKIDLDKTKTVEFLYSDENDIYFSFVNRDSYKVINDNNVYKINNSGNGYDILTTTRSGEQVHGLMKDKDIIYINTWKTTKKNGNLFYYQSVLYKYYESTLTIIKELTMDDFGNEVGAVLYRSFIYKGIIYGMLAPFGPGSTNEKGVRIKSDVVEDFDKEFITEGGGAITSEGILYTYSDENYIIYSFDGENELKSHFDTPISYHDLVTIEDGNEFLKGE